MVGTLRPTREEFPKFSSERRKNSCTSSRPIEASRVVALHWMSRVVSLSTIWKGSTSSWLGSLWVPGFPGSQGQDSKAGFSGYLPLSSSQDTQERVVLGPKGSLDW